MKFNLVAACLATCLAVPAWAWGWTLDPAQSAVSFGSIKNDYTGEAHSFGRISGTVDPAGMVQIDMDLTSVATNIDIRDERMVHHIFGDAATATMTAQVPLADLEALEVGASTIMEVEAELSLLGVETPLDVQVFVLRLAPDRVLVSTNAPAFVATEDLEIDQGVDILQELAGLDSITRVVPLTARLVFQK